MSNKSTQKKVNPFIAVTVSMDRVKAEAFRKFMAHITAEDYQQVADNQIEAGQMKSVGDAILERINDKL